MILARLFIALVFAGLLLPPPQAYAAPKVTAVSECCDQTGTPCRHCSQGDAQKACCVTPLSFNVATEEQLSLASIAPDAVQFAVTDFHSSARFDAPPSPPPRA